MSEFDIS